MQKFGTIAYRPNKKNATRVVARYATPVEAFDEYPDTPLEQSKSFPADREWEARGWLAEARKQIETGTWKPPQEIKREQRAQLVTYDEYFPQWLDARRVQGRPLKASTKYHNAGYYRNHIQPVLGSFPIAKTTAKTVHDFRLTLNSDQPDMVRCTMKVLRAMIRTACQPGVDGTPPLILRNPLVEAEPTPMRRSETTPATSEQLRGIYERMPADTRLSVYVATLITMRIGEVCALKVGDFDFDRGRLHIQRTRTTTPNADSYVTTPKTRTSDRYEPIPGALVGLVREHCRALCLTEVDWLFPASFDRVAPIRTNVLRAQFAKARATVGRPDLRFHDLRHTGLTWLAESGATVRELMDAAGHASPAIAMIYQHAADERVRAQSERLGARLLG